MKAKPKAPLAQQARRVKVAAGLAQGKPQTQIAQDLGVSRDTVNRDAQSADVRQICLELVAQRRERLDKVFDKAVTAVEDSLAANRVVVTIDVTYSEGKCDARTSQIHEYPDHFARLAGVKRYMELLTLGRPTPKPLEPESKTPVWTLEDLVRVIDQARAGAGRSH